MVQPPVLVPVRVMKFPEPEAPLKFKFPVIFWVVPSVKVRVAAPVDVLVRFLNVVLPVNVWAVIVALLMVTVPVLTNPAVPALFVQFLFTVIPKPPSVNDPLVKIKSWVNVRAPPKVTAP